MSTRTVEQIDAWSTVPFSGGYSGLHDLADSEFSGAVIAGPTRLFMLNGKVVGVLDGSIEDFEDASGTAREAPHPGLPLLAVMQERSDEVRAKYYTEDTPIAEVDQTLSSGNFTGYVELSENVLSGDYYQIYHQGRSMSVAWVGNNDQLLTEDEAFERADGEVGIYEVRPVDIEILDIPEPAEPDDGHDDGTDEQIGGAVAAGETTGDQSAAPDTADDAEDTDSVDASSVDDDSTRVDDEPAPPSEESAAATDSQSAPSGSDQVGEAGADSEQAHPAEPERAASDDHSQEASTDSTASAAETEASESARSESSSPASSETARAGRSVEQTSQSTRTTEPVEQRPTQDSIDPGGRTEERRSTPAEPREEPTDPPRPEQTSGVSPAPHDPSAGGPADLETRSIPSLDPSHSETASKTTPEPVPDEEPKQPDQHGQRPPASGRERTDAAARRDRQSDSAAETPQRQSRSEAQQPGQSAQRSREGHPGAPREQEPEPQSEAEPQSDPGRPSEPPREETDSERVSELEDELAETEAERERLASELESLSDERDELERELEAAREEIERLEGQLEELANDDTPDAETRLGQGEAIDQTNLFVRYSSKGDATLEAVHSGNAQRSAVDDNLRLEYHTQFDAATAAVGNQSFETFLTESIQYRFVDWLVRELLYEIRDTGNPEGMRELFDALPKIDRAELNGQISVEYTEDGEQHRSQEQFDVVVRDRMGNPLIVANINDSRDPATDDMMTDLITRAERVGSSSDSLAGAFLVTESFFEPPALETAEEATSSGLLSRDKRKSFVNLSRKDGYHLCLVEARNQEFHLAVPEL